MPDPSVYRFRPNAFAGTRTVRLTDDALVVEEDGKPRDGAFLDEIAEVQLAYAPTRFATNRYRARIVYRKGGMVELTNESYRSLGDFKEQNAEYAAFLTELHRRLAARGCAVRFVRGSSTAAYIGNAVLTAFIFACLAAIFVMLVAWGLYWIAVVKVAIILFFVPTLIRFMRRARPGGYDPTNLPADMLPALSTAPG